MKSEKGVTLASLGVYIIVILIVLITLTTITTYFRSNVNEFNTKTTVDLEFDKFNLYFIEEVKKTNNAIDESSSETKVVFSSGNTYEFKDNSIVLNGSIKIAEKIDNCIFSWSTDENSKQIAKVEITVGGTTRTNEYVLSNQTAENEDDEDYIYGYKRVEGTNELTLTNSIATNLKDYKIYGNSLQSETPSLNNSVEIQSVGDKTVNLVEISDATVSGSGTWTFKNLGDYELPAGTYTISAYYQQTGEDKPMIAMSVREYGATTPYYGGDSGTDESGYLTKTFTIPEGSKGCRIYAYSNDTATAYNTSCNFYDIQIQAGDVATEYEPYGKYKIPVKVSSKNLLNITTVAESNNYIDSFTGNLTVPSSTGGTWRASDFISIIGGRTYHLTAINNNTSAAGIAWYDSNKNYISGLNMTEVNNNNGNITAPTNANYLRISWRIDDGYNPDWKNTVQLEEGTEGTEYESYAAPITTNIYLDEPLRKVGDYADYIDFENKIIQREFISYVFDGSDDENWILSKQSDTKTCFYISCPNNDENWRDSGTTNSLCSHFTQNYTYATQVTNDSETYCCANTTNFLYIGILNSRLETFDVAGLKKWLSEQSASGNPFTVLVRSQTQPPETIELPNITTGGGTTILSIDTEIEPSNTEVVYYSK